MTDQNPKNAIIPAASRALSSSTAPKVMLPMLGTAALVWAGRRGLAMARRILAHQRQNTPTERATSTPTTLVYMRQTRVTIRVQQTPPDESS